VAMPILPVVVVVILDARLEGVLVTSTLDVVVVVVAVVLIIDGTVAICMVRFNLVAISTLDMVAVTFTFAVLAVAEISASNVVLVIVIKKIMLT